MEEDKLSLNPNRLVTFLKKDTCSFTLQDIVSFISSNGIRILHFNYVGGDGRLKTLSFSIRNEKHLRRLLEFGERVDGSSLFSYIDPHNSDLYVVPRFKTAFVNPFTDIPTLNIMCSYFNGDGKELEIAPEHIVKKAHSVLKEKTDLTLYALGELEYYVIDRKEDILFPSESQKNYHESTPFVNHQKLNNAILDVLTSIGIKIKYGHSEVGVVKTQEATYEQYEIELDLEEIEDMADHLVVAKWAMRNVAALHGVEISFTPKIAVGHAGTGLHIHLAAFKDGKNVLVDSSGLTMDAKKMIGGLLALAPSITAFGNTNPTSYLRLVPHQEAPTNICWGDKNRSVLVRVPLGWNGIGGMSSKANSHEDTGNTVDKQTVELRSPDGSANAHLLLASIAVAIKHGMTSSDTLKLAQDTYVAVDVFDDEKLQSSLGQLPMCCDDSASCLESQKEFYLKDSVFGERIIEGITKDLKAFNDKNLNTELKKNEKRAHEYIQSFLHWG